MCLMLSLGTDGGIGISLALVAVISCKVPGRVTGVEWAFTLRNIKVSEDEREPIEIEHHQTCEVQRAARLGMTREILPIGVLERRELQSSALAAILICIHRSLWEQCQWSA